MCLFANHWSACLIIITKILHSVNAKAPIFKVLAAELMHFRILIDNLCLPVVTFNFWPWHVLLCLNRAIPPSCRCYSCHYSTAFHTQKKNQNLLFNLYGWKDTPADHYNRPDKSHIWHELQGTGAENSEEKRIDSSIRFNSNGSAAMAVYRAAHIIQLPLILEF